MNRVAHACVLLLVLLICAHAVQAATPDELARTANKTIRAAENAFFNGELAEASSLLATGKEQLDELKAAAPDHRQVKNLQTKYDRLLARIEKKQAAASPKTPSRPSLGKNPLGGKKAAASGELSSGARSTLDTAGRNLDHAEERLEQARGFLAAGEFDRCRISLANAGDNLSQADVMLERARSSYKLTADHPVAGETFARREAVGTKAAELAQDLESGRASAEAGAAAAAASTAALDEQWLPRVESFTTYDSPTRLQGPSIHDAEALAQEDVIAADATTLLADYDATVDPSAASGELRAAVNQLRFKLEVYQNDRGAALRNKRGPIERELDEWEARLAGNDSWTEDSGTSLYFVRPNKIAHVEQLIDDLAEVAPADAEALSARLAGVKQSNDHWTARRQAWDARPRPFPEAGMSSAALEKTMTGLLEDRGWKVDRLVITDKDWWVQRGEFRYIAAAVMSRDDEGPYWSTVSFREDVTLAGYGPTQVWETGDKTRLP